MHQNLYRILKEGGKNLSPFLSFLSSSHRLILPPDCHSIQNRNAHLFSCILRHCTTCGMFLIMRVPPPVWGLSVEWLTWLHWLALGCSKPATWASSPLLCGRRFSEGLLAVLHDRPHACAHSNHPQHCRRIKRYTTELEFLESSSSAFPHACNVCVEVAPPVCSYRSWICVLRDTTGRVEHRLFTQVIPQSCGRFLHVLSWRSTS